MYNLVLTHIFVELSRPQDREETDAATCSCLTTKR